MEERLAWISLNQTCFHPRARLHDPAQLYELTESLRIQGQLQPCRGRPRDGMIEIYIGQGRCLAAKALSWDRIQVLLGDRSDEDVDLAMLHENLKRENLDPMTEAQEYDYLMKSRRWSQEQLALKVGKSQDVVSKTLSLLLLEDAVQDMTRRRVISKSHSFLISKVNDKGMQLEVARTVSEGGLSVKQTEDLVNLCLRRKGGSLSFSETLSELWSERTYGVVPPEVLAARQNDTGGADLHPPLIGSRHKSLQPAGANLGKFWPGLPPGVFARLEGGWFTLRFSPSKYPDIRAIFQELTSTAPERLPRNPSKRRPGKTRKAAEMNAEKDILGAQAAGGAIPSPS